MDAMSRSIFQSRDERRRDRRAPRFAPAGQSTQLIVGATPEGDRQILTLSHALYRHYRLRRVYYSAFSPVSNDPRLPHPDRPDLLREHRLYQADWLVRLYGFQPDEVFADSDTNLDRRLDPKTAWALRHPECFPVEINRAEEETLVRVPGLGLLSARRIVASRALAALTHDDLGRMGVVMKRARHFITCSGRRDPTMIDRPELLRACLLREATPSGWTQGELFDHV
jgi:predicted DNA-binding helix-hairpin-helix protein